MLSHSVVSDSVQPYGWEPSRLLCPRDSPGRNTGVGSHALLQGMFPTQELNPRLLMSPAFAGGLFTTGATWDARESPQQPPHSTCQTRSLKLGEAAPFCCPQPPRARRRLQPPSQSPGFGPQLGEPPRPALGSS